MNSDSIDLNNYTKLEFLGQGKYAEVYKVRDKRTNKILAAKILKDNFIDKSIDDIKSLKQEVINMDKSRHPAVLKLYGLSETNFNNEKKPTLIIEYLPNGSLNDILDQERHSLSPEGWDATQKLITIYGIASGMSYLHSKSIIHRDLKPANILMDQYLNPKISDFGFSKDLDDSSQSIVAIKGTHGYIAPEVYESIPYSFPVDVYSFSYIAYEILTNIAPFEGSNMAKILLQIVNNERPPIDSSVPLSYRKLIESCWKRDPEERPTFNDIVQLLETDEGFITPEIDKDKYYDYIDYIKNGNKSHNSSLFKRIRLNKKILNKIITKRKRIEAGEEEEEEEFNESENSEDHSKSSIEKVEKSDIIETKEKVEEVKIEENEMSDAMLLKQMADNGDPESMFYYGRLCYFGEEVPLDKQEAARYFRQSADLGYLSSMNFIGNMLFKGDGIPQDRLTSSQYYKAASDLGDYEAMTNYAILIYNGYSVEKNKKEAARLFKCASENGNLRAMNNYANVLYGGNGIPMNKKEAALLYKKAADLGYSPAMNNYANMLIIGDGIEKDQPLALEYYEKAADKGFEFAAYNYARILEKGELIKADPDEIFRYYKIAAEKKHIYACYRYGHYLMSMNKLDEANKYLKCAGDGSISDAAFYYGKNLYFYGEDNDNSKEEGVKYLELSRNSNNEKSDLFLYLINLKKSCNIC